MHDLIVAMIALAALKASNQNADWRNPDRPVVSREIVDAGWIVYCQWIDRYYPDAFKRGIA